VLGLHTSARKLAGEEISYADEVEWCYGVRPRRVDEEVFTQAQRLLAEALPGDGDLAERLVDWRESHAVPVDILPGLLESLSADLRARTAAMFGLPDGEQLVFELVTDEPWSGFNYYLGGLRSRVAINIDLPVLSLSLAHLVAHEAYPGHHTEHCLKEAGLVRLHRQTEETIFCVGTPQCLLAEGLADLGVEVVLGTEHESVLAAHVRAAGLKLDPDVMAAVGAASRDLLGVRGNVGLMLHDDGRPPDDAAAYLARWGLQSPARAAKAVGFFLDPTWRAYSTCYVEGLPLCRSFVAADPQRFRRLLTEQLLPADLIAAAP
jgi:Arc/MetJ family transcription regulator